MVRLANTTGCTHLSTADRSWKVQMTSARSDEKTCAHSSKKGGQRLTENLPLSFWKHMFDTMFNHFTSIWHLHFPRFSEIFRHFPTFLRDFTTFLRHDLLYLPVFDGVSPLGEHFSPEVLLRMASALFSFIDSIGETFEGVVENAARRRYFDGNLSWWFLFVINMVI